MTAQPRPTAMAEVRPRRAGAAAPTPGRHRAAVAMAVLVYVCRQCSQRVKALQAHKGRKLLFAATVKQ